MIRKCNGFGVTALKIRIKFEVIKTKFQSIDLYVYRLHVLFLMYN